MAVEMCDVEVFVLVNSEGEYVASADADKLAQLYTDDVGDLAEAEGIRRVKLTVKVPLPKPIELVGTASETEEATLKVA